MPELDLESIEIINPTSEGFTWRYNGTPYTIQAGEKKAFARPVAYHLAKHLSSKMVVDEVWSKLTREQAEIARADHKNQIHLKVSQLQAYDTHERRIALYRIFGGTENVIKIIERYPFKGFIGDMHVYEMFVQREDEAKKAPTPPPPAAQDNGLENRM